MALAERGRIDGFEGPLNSGVVCIVEPAHPAGVWVAAECRVGVSIHDTARYHIGKDNADLTRTLTGVD